MTTTTHVVIRRSPVDGAWWWTCVAEGCRLIDYSLGQSHPTHSAALTAALDHIDAADLAASYDREACS